MTLLHGGLNLFTLSGQLVLSLVFLVSKVTLGKLELFNLLPTALFVFLGILREFFKLVFLVFQRLRQVFDTAT